MGTGNSEGWHRAGAGGTQPSRVWHPGRLVLRFSPVSTQGLVRVSSLSNPRAPLRHKTRLLVPLPDQLRSSPQPASVGLVTQSWVETLRPPKAHSYSTVHLPLKKKPKNIQAAITSSTHTLSKFCASSCVSNLCLFLSLGSQKLRKKHRGHLSQPHPQGRCHPRRWLQSSLPWLEYDQGLAAPSFAKQAYCQTAQIVRKFFLKPSWNLLPCHFT